MIKQLMPVEVVRDDYGFWVHPVLSKYLNDLLGDREGMTESEHQKMMRDLGVTFYRVEMEWDCPEELQEKYWGEGDIDATKDWNPSKPKLTGDWFLVSINDAEDGPVAWWAKPRANLPESTKINAIDSNIDKQVNLMDQFIADGGFDKAFVDVFGLPESVKQSLREIS